MGRKKRKVAEDDQAAEVDEPPVDNPVEAASATAEEATIPETTKSDVPDSVSNAKDDTKEADTSGAAASSSYAMHTHSGEIIQEDVYVSDGSDDDEELLQDLDIVLAGSRMGLMRRGLHHPSMLLQQAKREWVRGGTTATETTEGATADGNAETNAGEGGDTEEARMEQRRLEEEALLAKLDPAQRAARLLQEKQRKLEEAKEEERRLESEENAGRDPSVFSKRTAFDIRFDQIEEKPWTIRGDISDYFNYGLSEETWLEYAENQLQIRQELIDAQRQKRPPDPNIVPVQPRAPKAQTPRVAVADSSTEEAADGTTIDGEANEDKADDAKEAVKSEAPGEETIMGPVLVKKEAAPSSAARPSASESPVVPDGKKGLSNYYSDSGDAFGAWGAGTNGVDETLARLLEEQQRGGPEGDSGFDHGGRGDDEPRQNFRGQEGHWEGNGGDWQNQRRPYHDRGHGGREPFNDGGHYSRPGPPPSDRSSVSSQDGRRESNYPPPPPPQGGYQRGGRGFRGRGGRGRGGRDFDPRARGYGRGDWDSGPRDYEQGDRKRGRDGDGDPRYRRR